MMMVMVHILYDLAIHTSSIADWVSCTRHMLIVWPYVKPSMSVIVWRCQISSCVLRLYFNCMLFDGLCVECPLCVGIV